MSRIWQAGRAHCLLPASYTRLLLLPVLGEPGRGRGQDGGGSGL